MTATLKINDTSISTNAIVAIYIDSDGKIIASTNLDGTITISNNHIGTPPDPPSNLPHLEVDIKVAMVGVGSSVQPLTISVLKTCYTHTGRPYTC
jgi:hypothetical protein